MDNDVTDKARSVFTALAVHGVPLVDVLASDFANWRLFFRHVKDSLNDPTTNLGELSSGSFLGKRDIVVANWGTRVKERSPLFKAEFEAFILIDEVRNALAADLGMEALLALPVTTAPAVSAVAVSSLAQTKQPTEESIVVPQVTPAEPVNDDHATNNACPAVPKTPVPITRVAHDTSENTNDDDSVEPDVMSGTHVTAAYHRQRICSYLDGFKTLLVDLQERVDEIATCSVVTVAGAVERANLRLEQALERVETMTLEETAT